jgi:hypothetical protein
MGKGFKRTIKGQPGKCWMTCIGKGGVKSVAGEEDDDE